MASPDFGRDVSLDTDLDPLGRDVTGTVLMTQVAIRRLSTRRGTLFSNPNALSIDLRDYLSSEISATDAPKIQAQTRAALLDDERIAMADVSVTINTRARTMTVNVKCIGAAGPFAFTLLVSAVTIQVLSAT